MRSVPVLATFAALALGLGACSEGFEDTVWVNADGTRTLSLYDGGAAWDESYLDATKGDPVVTRGLRFEGVFTDSEDDIDVDVSCVSAENAQIGTACDTKVARRLSCALSADDDATLTCKIGKDAIELHRQGVRRVGG